MNVSFVLNGDPVSAEVAADLTLLDLLRNTLELTGTKWGCRMGDCGACTVLVGDSPSLACLQLAAQVDGAEVTTVEGLERDGTLSDLQAALVEAGGIQCGFCTPGMLMASEALLRRAQGDGVPDDATVRQELSGNLCRCTGYPKIVQAVVSVAQRRAAQRA
jgi:aerobic carbon-monoxide dehydrogenase small subunit